jgi:hypothetical protein
VVVEAVSGEVTDDKGQEEKEREEAGYLYPAGCGLLGF